MARFRAYSSDNSSSSDEEEKEPVQEKTPERPSTRVQRNVDEQLSESEQSESSSSSSSKMQDDELQSSPSRRFRKTKGQDRNALVEDENGDVHFAHEVDVRVSPPSTPSRSSPPRTISANRGDSTIIPWAQHVGVDAQKMHVMQTSLFRMPEEAAALKAASAATKGPASGIRLEVKKNQSINRKHSRDSDGDGLRIDSHERVSFGQDVEQQLFRPTRKYARVGITSSIANGNEGSYIDAGLAMGRSFRVGWGPTGQLVHLGTLCSPSTTSTASANTSTVVLTRILPSLITPNPDSNGPALSQPTPPQIAAKLLQHHLSHTTISRDDSGIPCAYPTTSASASTSTTRNTFSQTSTPSADPLNFTSFTTLFPTTDTTSPAPIFRLGGALFDPITLHLGRTKPTSITGGSNITPDLRNRVNLLRRKTALSKWLENVVKPVVDGDLRLQASGTHATYTPADASFTQLTGHQISEACATAADGGYLKLATLISQAGGDSVYKDDIRAQLDIWKSEKLSPGANNTVTSTQNGLIGRGVWRVYNLLAGLEQQENPQGRSEEDVFAGLDWKRVFGLFLWYGTTVDASVADAVAAYERLVYSTSKGTSIEIARPISKWASSFSKQGPQLPTSTGHGLGLYLGSSNRQSKDNIPNDPLYVLIKLHADPALSLTSALDPRSFAPSGMDWGIGMCWHLYVILSRVMRVRDFSDRGDPGVRALKVAPTRGRSSMLNGFSGNRSGTSINDDEDEVQPDGHSPTADLLASSYAFELQSWGMIQEAAFVLLHLEGSTGREKALKDLLARSAPKFNDWMIRGLVGSLRLPMTWVDEAKAMYEFDSGRFFAAYELYLSAQLYNSAHTLAYLELAPDAIIRKDLELLHSLFSPFDSDGKRDKVEGWFVRGKVLLDYVETVTKLPKLLDAVLAENEDGETVPDAAQSEQIDFLSKRIPRLIALLPDILHRSHTVDPRHPAALEEMTKELLKLEERARPLLLSQIQQTTIGVLDGATKINLIRGLGYARFMQSIEV